MFTFEFFLPDKFSYNPKLSKINSNDSDSISPEDREQKEKKQKSNLDSSGHGGAHNLMAEHEKKEKERFLMFIRVLMK